MKNLLLAIIIVCWLFAIGCLGFYIGKNSQKISVLEIAPNTGQPGYQISYLQRGEIKYYYPITENGKNAFMKAIGEE